MDWAFLAPWIENENQKWLFSEINNPGGKIIPVPSGFEHDSFRMQTSAAEWWQYLKYANKALKVCHPSQCGYITLFPQIPTALGLRKRFSACNYPIIAWSFNLGALYSGIKGEMAKHALNSVDKFIVHSTSEVSSYSSWLNIDISRFEFVPLHRPLRPIGHTEEQDSPFILAMGAARRDYTTLISAVKKLGYRTIIVAPEHALSGIDIPNTVEVLSNLTIDQCNTLTQQARICIVPIANNVTASGQITVIDAMMYGRPVIATDCIGTHDYIKHEKNGLLVPIANVDKMTEAISELWKSHNLREYISQQAKSYAMDNYSKPAAAKKLKILMQEFDS